MPALVFLLRFGSSLQCDTLSVLGIVHHNKTVNASMFLLVFQEHTTCVSLAAIEPQT